MELVLLGPPGSGKGTQAKRLSQHFSVPHVSTGDLFRENLSQNTELGQLAKGYMAQGTLVPDDVTEAMVRDRLARPDAASGFILDGFPRNVAQAHRLAAMMDEMARGLTQVIYLKVRRGTLMARLTGRRVCPQCGALYHLLFNPPKTAGLCDKCGANLQQRDDDSEETVLRRLRVYDEETAPLVDYYRGQDLLTEFDGEHAVDQVAAAIIATLEGYRDRA